ncbi:16679_t:CDS:2, partial [Entrophospora sp. SA101]
MVIAQILEINDLDIMKFCPALMRFVNDDEIKEEMEQDFCKMFDPVIEKIICLIHNQLASSKEESPYLVSIKKTFNSQ